MEKRLARLEQVIPRPEPEPEMETSFEDLSFDEQIELYLLLELAEEYQRFWNPGRALTPKEEARMTELLSRGKPAPARYRERR